MGKRKNCKYYRDGYCGKALPGVECEIEGCVAFIPVPELTEHNPSTPESKTPVGKYKMGASKRAEKAAIKAYPLPNFGEVNISDTAIMAAQSTFRARDYYIEGYKQAEKDTIERATEWLQTNKDDYSFTWFNPLMGESGITEECIHEFQKAMEE